MSKPKYSEKVINAFLNNMKTVDIAREGGISETTVRKYRKDPELQRLVSERRSEMVQAAVGRMQGYLQEGVETLIQIIRDPETSAQTRVNAIQLIFNQCRDWMTTTEIQQRLEAIEKANLSDLTPYDGFRGVV